MPKHLLRDHEPFQRPSDYEVRVSIGRIVDILQQLVLARPDMIVAFGEIVEGIVESRARVVTKSWERRGELRSRARRAPPSAH